MATFSEVFKGLRISNGYTQDELAKKLNFSKSRVNMYERGEREPNFEALELISDFFNVDMNFLLGKTNKTTRILPGVNVPESDYTQIIELYDQLNKDGQNRVTEYAADLVATGKYERPASPDDTPQDFQEEARAIMDQAKKKLRAQDF